MFCVSSSLYCVMVCDCGLSWSYSGIFLDQILGQISAPTQLKNEHNLPKMLYDIPNFFAFLHFSENFMKIGPKIAKLQMFSFTLWRKSSWVNIKSNAIYVIALHW